MDPIRRATQGDDTLPGCLPHPAAFGIAVLCACLGCGHDPLAARKSLDLTQALHGHWSSKRVLHLAQTAGPWDTTGAAERWNAEIDRYIDVRSEPKTWSEITGERGWRVRSQEPTTGIIAIETWPAGQPAETSTIELRFDALRATLLEQLPALEGQRALREWMYINDQGKFTLQCE